MPSIWGHASSVFLPVRAIYMEDGSSRTEPGSTGPEDWHEHLAFSGDAMLGRSSVFDRESSNSRTRAFEAWNRGASPRSRANFWILSI